MSSIRKTTSSADDDEWKESLAPDEQHRLEEMDQFLRLTLGQSTHQSAEKTLGDSLDHSLGQLLPDRFRVLRMLGQGTFGVVLLAHDTMLGRDVAVKVLRPQWFINASTKERFLRESRTAARLDHTAIVRVLEAGENDCVAWQVCEAIHGDNLAEHLRHSKIEQATVVRWVKELANATQCAHEHGVLHRDVKPENVLIDVSVGADLSNASAYLSDFGLAKVLDEGTDLSRSGMILGTPCHMAPEQFESGNVHLKPTVDVYSLGVLLYECLAGVNPFHNASTIAQRIALCLTTRPSIRRDVPDIPRDLETICSKSLEPNPDNRYATAGDLADELNRYINGLPIQTKRPTMIQSGIAMANRNRILTGLVASLFVCFAAMMGLALSTRYIIRNRTTAVIEVEKRLVDETLRAKQLSAETSKYKEESAVERQHLWELEWETGIREAYQHWEANELWQTSQRLDSLRKTHAEFFERTEAKLLVSALDGQFQTLGQFEGAIDEIRYDANNNRSYLVTDKGEFASVGPGRRVSVVDLGHAAMNALAIHPRTNRALIGVRMKSDDVKTSVYSVNLANYEQRQVFDSFSATVDSIEFEAGGETVLCASRYENPRLYRSDSAINADDLGKDISSPSIPAHSEGKEIVLGNDAAVNGSAQLLDDAVSIASPKFNSELLFELPGGRRNDWLKFMPANNCYFWQQNHRNLGFASSFPPYVRWDVEFGTDFGQHLWCATQLGSSSFIAVGFTNPNSVYVFDSRNWKPHARIVIKDYVKIETLLSNREGFLLAMGLENGKLLLCNFADQPWWIERNQNSQTENNPREDHLKVDAVPPSVTHLEPELEFRVSPNAVISLAFNKNGLLVGTRSGTLHELPLSEHLQDWPNIVTADIHTPWFNAFCEESLFQRYSKGATYAIHDLNSYPSNNDELIAADWKLLSKLSATKLDDNGEFPSDGILCTSNQKAVAWLNSMQQITLYKDGEIQRIPIQLSSYSSATLVGISDNGELAAIRANRFWLIIVDLRNHGQVISNQELPINAQCVTWDSNLRKAFVGSQTDPGKVYEIRFGSNETRMVTNVPSTCNKVKTIANDSKIISAHANGIIAITNLETGLTSLMQAHATAVRDFAIDNNEKIGCSIDVLNNVSVWSIASRKLIGRLMNKPAEGLAWPVIQFSPSNDALFAVLNSKSGPVVRKWKLAKSTN